MSASGVDKSNMTEIGRDILMVKGFDRDRNVMLLSVPLHVRPRRVSVDAIEHWMIYTEHPEVGAIVHIHAWMENVKSTTINYPCGTIQLPAEVADSVRHRPPPPAAGGGPTKHRPTITRPRAGGIFRPAPPGRQRLVPPFS